MALTPAQMNRYRSVWDLGDDRLHGPPRDDERVVSAWPDNCPPGTTPDDRLRTCVPVPTPRRCCSTGTG